MKIAAMLNRSILATLLLSASVAAFAGGGGGGGGGGPRGAELPLNISTPSHGHYSTHALSKFTLHSDAISNDRGSTSSGKTSSAQIGAELLQPEEAGQISDHRNE